MRHSCNRKLAVPCREKIDTTREATPGTATMPARARPISGQMSRLAGGHRDIDVRDTDRPDEIGELARSLLVFAKSGRKLDELFVGRRENAERRKADGESGADRIQSLHERVARADGRLFGQERERREERAEQYEQFLHSVLHS